MTGPFDPIFDFNRDGKMSAFEKGAEADFIDRMCRKERSGSGSSSDRDHDWTDHGDGRDFDFED